MLKALSIKDLELELTENEVRITSDKSKTKIRLVTMPTTKFEEVCDIPDAPTQALKCDAGAFLAGIRTCLRSVSTDTSIPDQLGVTILPNDTGCVLYATNGQTLTRSIVKFKGESPFTHRAILSSLFCKQLLELADAGKPLKLHVAKDHAIFVDDKGTVLFGLLVESEKPLPYTGVFNQHYKRDRDGELVPIASKLGNIVERACVIAAAEAIAVQTKITVKNGIAKFHTSSRLGDVNDELKLVDGHPDTELLVDPKHLRAGIGDFDKMLITERCFVMANQTAFYLTAGKG
jgi:DNA polymerase III sliding clamp (beta) subunit (PCNA family)